MDDIDRMILAYIQKSGRDPFATIGAGVGLSASAAHERVRRLEARGAIRGWAARVDPAAAGLPVLAFVFVAVDRDGEAGLVATACARPEVLEVHHVTGEWSYLLKLRCASIAALETLLREVIKPHGAAVRSHTIVALSSPKETATLAPVPA
jgi:Lrp/AsnC family leucine-responsive transcriptional regulator